MEGYVIRQYDLDNNYIGIVGAPIFSETLAKSSCETWNKILTESVCRVEKEQWDEPESLRRLFERCAEEVRRKLNEQ